MKKEIVFTVDMDGKEVELVVKKPTARVLQEANKYHQTIWVKSFKGGNYLRDELTADLINRGIWNQKKENQVKTLEMQIKQKVKQLDAGGIKLSLAKQVAIDSLKLRRELNSLVADRSAFDDVTVEAESDNARFNYIVSKMVYYTSSGKPVFQSVEDYLDKSNEEYAAQSAEKLLELLMDVDDFTTPEVKFLQSYGFMDDEGFLLDDNKNRIDLDGNLVNTGGEASPFLDEDGNPVELELTSKE